MEGVRSVSPLTWVGIYTALGTTGNAASYKVCVILTTGNERITRFILGAEASPAILSNIPLHEAKTNTPSRSFCRIPEVLRQSCRR